MPARFLNWGVPAPECLDLELSDCNIFPDPGKVKDLGLSWREVLLEWRCEAEGGLERGGPKGSGSPTTFMFEML